MSRSAAVVLLALIATPAAAAEPREVRYGPEPAWTVPSPAPTAMAAPEGAPLRFAYLDQQVRVSPAGAETYTHYRMKLLTPEALAAGNVLVNWTPSSDTLTVHALKVHRDAATIDVLKDQRFDLIQRENNLEKSMLDGELTAALQTPGLQVGDELEFAATILRRDPTLGDAAGAVQLPVRAAPGAFRFRLLGVEGAPLQWRATPDLPAPAVTRAGGRTEAVFELRDPGSVIETEGAPARFNVRRSVQYSGFASWAALSAALRPLFDAAATLKPGSPLKAEAARIAQASTDPAARALAALRLVEDRVRYVYVGLDGANYRPAPADETWSRRFGDCKAKTALLLALLRELDVPAEAVLVNAAGGDGLDAWLPTPAAFNHVLVRADLGGGRRVWLDGTRLGDRSLAALRPTPYRQVLPLQTADARLEAVAPAPADTPEQVEAIEIDARAGFTAAAKVKAQLVMRGDAATLLRTQLGALGPDDSARAQKSYWRDQWSGLEPAAVSFRYLEAEGALVLSVSGEMKLDWTGSDKEGHDYSLPGAGFTPPAPLKRPAEQDQKAPWALDFPTFKCWVTTVQLPQSGAKRRWDFLSDPVDRQLGGVAYWRQATLTGDVVRTVMSRRVLQPEISAEQARALNAAVPQFDNKISRVFEVAVLSNSAKLHPPATVYMGAEVDWTAADAPCRTPGPRQGTPGAAQPLPRPIDHT